MVAIRERLKINMSRYWEVDMVRGIAIILMVFYHFMWDLNFYRVISITMTSGPWQWFARGIATIFITVMGVSSVISYNRGVQNSGQTNLFSKFLLRGLKIFGWGLVVTLMTYLTIGRGFVVFGILHLIGFAVIVTYPFLPYQRRYLALVVGLIGIALGVYLNDKVSYDPWLIWLGVKQVGRLMVDYYPALPWVGVALMGIFTGQMLYPGGVARFNRPDNPDQPFIRLLTFLGQHSLLIYLIHQPILQGLLILSGIGSL